MDFRGVNRALHQAVKGAHLADARLPDWIEVGRTLKYISQSRGDEHVVNVEKIEDIRRSVIVRFEQDRHVWKRIPFTEINPQGNGILQPMWKRPAHEKAILTVPEKPADFVEAPFDDAQNEEAAAENATVEGPQLPPDGEKLHTAEEIPKESDANREAEASLEAQPEEEPEARGSAPESKEEASKERLDEVEAAERKEAEHKAAAEKKAADEKATARAAKKAREEKAAAEKNAAEEKAAVKAAVKATKKAREEKAAAEKRAAEEKAAAEAAKKALEEQEREKEALADDSEENACTDPYAACTDPYLDLADACEAAEVCADPYLDTAALEPDAPTESSVVAEEQEKKPSSKDVKGMEDQRWQANKRKAAKERDVPLPEAAPPKTERPVASNADTSAGTVRREAKYAQVHSIMASMETDEPDALPVKKVKGSKRKADVANDVAAQIAEDSAAEPAATTHNGRAKSRRRDAQADIQTDVQAGKRKSDVSNDVAKVEKDSTAEPASIEKGSVKSRRRDAKVETQTGTQASGVSKETDEKEKVSIAPAKVPAASAKRGAKDTNKAFKPIRTEKTVNEEVDASSKDAKAINEDAVASSKNEKGADRVGEKSNDGVTDSSKKIARGTKTSQKKAADRMDRSSGGGTKRDNDKSHDSNCSDCADDRIGGRGQVARRQGGNRRGRSCSSEPRPARRRIRNIVRESDFERNCDRSRPKRRRQCRTRARSPRRRDRDRSDSRYSYYSSYSPYSEAAERPPRPVRRHGRRRVN